MNVSSFTDLNVWEKGHRLTIEIYKMTKLFPSHEQFGLVNQIRRSAVSISANVAEGYKKGTKEFRRYLEISQGSLEETKYYLILSKDLNYCSKEQFDSLYEKANEIGKMTNSLIKKLLN